MAVLPNGIRNIIGWLCYLRGRVLYRGTVGMLCPHCHTREQLYSEVGVEGIKEIVCLPCGYRASVAGRPLPPLKTLAAFPEKYPQEAKLLAVSMKRSGLKCSFIREYIKQRYGLMPSYRSIALWGRVY